MPRKSTNISSWADWYSTKYLPSVKRFSLQLKRRFPDRTEEIDSILLLYEKKEMRIAEFHRDTLRRAGKSWREICMKLMQKGFPKTLTLALTSREQDAQSDDEETILRAIERKISARVTRGYAHSAVLKQLAGEYREYADAIYERFGQEKTGISDDMMEKIQSKYSPPYDDKQRTRITRYLMSRGYGWDDVSKFLKQLG